MKVRKRSITVVVLLAILLLAFSCELVVLYAIRNVEINVNNPNLVVEYGDLYDENATATIFGKFDVSKYMYTSGRIDTYQLGKQTVTYTCFAQKVTKTVEVRDTTAPKINLVGAEFYFIQDDFSNYEELGFSAFDNVDGNITSKVEVMTLQDGNEYTFIYSVKDSSGNSAQRTRTVSVVPKTQEIVNYQPESTGVVYLTFDDGPSSLTPKYLDVLREYGVNATFFVVEFSEEDREWKLEIMQRALDEGNQIALHGNSHEYSQIYSSLSNATDNFYSQNELLKRELGIDARIVRFPGGSSNTVSKRYCIGVMTNAADVLTANGYSYFDWNVDSNDAGLDVTNSQNIYQNVIDGVVAGRKNVVLMHDSGNHKATLEALPKIIEKLLEEGYEFRVITIDTEPVRHKIGN